MTTKPTVLLFDIDGTLIDTGGAGRRAMEAAFGGPGYVTFSFAGMTDRAIVRGGLLAKLGVDPSEAEIDAFLDSYLGHLGDGLPASTRYRVLPGVPAVLAHVTKVEGVATGLGTGNVKRGAYVKLAHGGMTEEHLPFGGFGCDHEDRAELLRIGATRGAERLGHALSACRVVVIGDTPKDVAAAQRIGAECVGVGTGGFPADQLLVVGATVAFPTLEHPAALAAILGA